MSTLNTVNLDIVGDYSRHGYDEFDSKRTLNMYAAVDLQGKNKKALFTRPGLKEIKTLVRRGGGSGRGRAAHIFDNKVFIVIDDKIYSLDTSFNIVYLGEILTDRGYVGIEDNGTECVFVDGKGGWVYNKNTGLLAKITNPGFLNNPIDVTVLAQRFIVCQAESFVWGISEKNNANSWSTLNRAELTAYPDTFVGLGRLRGLLYLFGRRSVEVWYNEGLAFQFSQQSIQTLDYGCASAGSIAINFEYAIWLARYYNGQVSIVMTNGGEPEKISTTAIEEELSLYENTGDASAYIFKNRLGYIFYVINFTQDNRTWMYCLTTQSWSQLSYKDKDRWLPEAYFFYKNKHFVLPYNANSILELSDQFYDDAGVSIKKMREVGVFSLPDYKEYLLCEICFDMKTGVGHESGNDDDPLLRLEISKDGGITYENQLSQKIGKIGKRKTKVRFFNLGISEDTVFRIENYNKIPFVLLGCSLVVGIQ